MGTQGWRRCCSRSRAAASAPSAGCRWPWEGLQARDPRRAARVHHQQHVGRRAQHDRRAAVPGRDLRRDLRRSGWQSARVTASRRSRGSGRAGAHACACGWLGLVGRQRGSMQGPGRHRTGVGTSRCTQLADWSPAASNAPHAPATGPQTWLCDAAKAPCCHANPCICI